MSDLRSKLNGIYGYRRSNKYDSRRRILIDLRLIKSNNLSISPQATTQFIKKDRAHSIKENFKNQNKYHSAR